MFVSDFLTFDIPFLCVILAKRFYRYPSYEGL